VQLRVAVGTAEAATERPLTCTGNGLVGSLTDGETTKTSYVYDGFDRVARTPYASATKGSGTSNAADDEQLNYEGNSNLISHRGVHQGPPATASR